MKKISLLKEKIVPAFIGGFAIFLISFLLKFTVSNAILFASLGASTVVLSEFPDTRMAKLRTVIIAYLIAAIIGYLASFINYMPLAAGLGVFLTISIMLATNNVHAPAGGVVLAFVFHARSPLDVLYLMITIIGLLIILKSVIYLYKKELKIEKFHHEFLKEY